MVFVFTFAVAGGSGKVISMPNWALVSFSLSLSLSLFFFFLYVTISFCFNRILLEIQIIVNDSHSLFFLCVVLVLEYLPLSYLNK